MRPLIKNRASVLFLMLALACMLCAGKPWAQLEQKESPIELTKQDLFSLKDWQHRPVMVDGFMLGMTRAEALATAHAGNIELYQNTIVAKGPVQESCKGASCSVGKVNGDWIGLDIGFGAADRVTTITVSVPEDAYPEVKKVNIAREFKGLTYQFFNQYSDSLRTQILGTAKGKETHDVLSTGPDSFYTHIEYDYLSCGVIVHVTVSKQDPKPFDLAMDFVVPQ
jgi:hypothetical protein